MSSYDNISNKIPSCQCLPQLVGQCHNNIFRMLTERGNLSHMLYNYVKLTDTTDLCRREDSHVVLRQ